MHEMVCYWVARLGLLMEANLQMINYLADTVQYSMSNCCGLYDQPDWMPSVLAM